MSKRSCYFPDVRAAGSSYEGMGWICEIVSFIGEEGSEQCVYHHETMLWKRE